MTYERTMGPLMSDAIMYHNEDRIRANHPFARKPQASLLGLKPYGFMLEQSIRKDSSPKAKTTLITENHGFSHTGSGLGVHYEKPCIDSKYK